MTLRTVHEQIVSQTNSFHRDVRAFRNRLVIATLISAGAIAAVVFSQWRLPMAELLQMPKGTDGVARYAVLTLVMLFGAIGGLVASIPSLATTPRIASPFSFPIEQALLKVVVGSLTALVGVIVVGSVGVSSGFASLQSLLGVSVVFGAAQQAVTRFLDKRANQIIATSE